MRIVFFGVEDLGERCLSALLRERYQVVGVVTLPGLEASETAPGLLKRLMGHRAPMSVPAIAERRRLPLAAPLKLRDPAFHEWLAERRPDLLVVACFDKILPASILALATHGGLNVHPSLLPRHRGPAPVARSILAGDAETGISVHLMEATIDTGAIVTQHRHPIRPDDTAGSLAKRLAAAAPAALLEAMGELRSGRGRAVVQSGDVTQAPFITRDEGHLDWRAPLPHLLRTIRACNPYPGAFLVTNNTLVAVLEADPESGDPGAFPGQVLEVGPRGVVIQTLQGALRCKALRRGGAKVPPDRYRDLFALGDCLPSGDWSLV